MIEIQVPAVGESITEVRIGRWLKKPGDRVSKDEDLVELETDKASVTVPAPESGVLSEILKKDGEAAAVGEALARLDAASEGTPRAQAPAPTKPRPEPEEPRPQAAPPTARRMHGGDGNGAQGRKTAVEPAPAAEVPRPSEPRRETDETVPMTPLRRAAARRLLEAQRETAMVTTFNEVDLGAVQEERERHRARFEERHGVRLGLMSFFVRAVVDALRRTPVLNAEVRGEQIAYHRDVHLGIAVAGPKGLLVPVLRDAGTLGFSEIEKGIDALARRARENRIRPEDLEGGTFTITNGGVFGSLLSTPMLNPPQSGILGMHAVQDRPVARGGQVVVRPMMFLALTYDHRLVDGREAVTFLKSVKETLEDPMRLLLEI